LLNRRIFILANINTQNAVKMRLLRSQQVINAVVIKAHAVDQPFGITRRKILGLSLPGCDGRHGTNFNGTKPIAPSASMHSPFLSSPAARPSGFKCEPHRLPAVGTFWRTNISSGYPKHGVIVEK
jgi:hypothetical protein